MSVVDLVHVEYEQQGRILPDIITLKHFVNVQAQERAHLSLLKVHYANSLPDASTAVGARRFTSLRNPCDSDRYSSLQDVVNK